MKRADMLRCADMTPGRFDILRKRGQLPISYPESFVREHDALDEAVNSYCSNYTLDDAFRLRLMLDLLGGETDAEILAGLTPTYAVRMIANILGRFDPHPMAAPITGPNLWGAVVVFEDEGGNPERFTGHFVGRIEELPRWLAEQSVKHREHYSRGLDVVRVFLVNASRAAAFVRLRAIGLGLPEANDLPEMRQ